MRSDRRAIIARLAGVVPGRVISVNGGTARIFYPTGTRHVPIVEILAPYLDEARDAGR